MKGHIIIVRNLPIEAPQCHRVPLPLLPIISNALQSAPRVLATEDPPEIHLLARALPFQAFRLTYQLVVRNVFHQARVSRGPENDAILPQSSDRSLIPRVHRGFSSANLVTVSLAVLPRSSPES